jgi:hypothetical protein
MRDHRFWRRVVLVFFLLLVPSPAFAYGGPGLGAGAIAVALGVLGSIVTAIFGFIYYPLKRVIKKIKKGRHSAKESQKTR